MAKRLDFYFRFFHFVNLPINTLKAKFIPGRKYSPPVSLAMRRNNSSSRKPFVAGDLLPFIFSSTGIAFCALIPIVYTFTPCAFVISNAVSGSISLVSGASSFPSVSKMTTLLLASLLVKRSTEVASPSPISVPSWSIPLRKPLT